MPGQNSQPKVQLAELREYVSQNGNQYFSGYMGRTRLVLFKDPNAECTGQEVGRWNLLIEEAQPRDGQTASSGAPQRAQTSRTTFQARRTQQPGRKSTDRRAADLLRERGIDPGSPMRDDDIGF